MANTVPQCSDQSISSRPLRFGVVGLGLRSGIASLAHQPESGAELVVAADPNPEARSNFAERFPGVSLVDGLDRMLELSDLDAVFIASPDYLHEEQAIVTLNAGVSVYLEKPMAITVEGCDRILAAAKRNNQKIYVGHNMRHFPVMQKMKELIDNGAIGEVKTAWCRHFISFGGDAYFKDWHAERCNTTGLLLQKGAHDIDILHWLCGGYSKVVTAMGGLTVYDQTGRRHVSLPSPPVAFKEDNWPPLTQTDMNPTIDVEDVSMMLMQLDNGIYASYQQCHFTPDYYRNYTIIGTEGRIENDGDTPGNAVVKLWNRRTDNRCEPNLAFSVPAETGTHGGADPRIIGEFIAYLRTNCPTQTSPIAARMAVAAGCAATESLRNGSVPQTVPPLPDASSLEII